TGGDACLSLSISQPLLRELAPAELLQPRDAPMFRNQSLRIDARAQVLVALLRHSLRSGAIEPLEAESLVLTLVCRSLGPRTAHAAGSTRVRQRLVDRAKLLLASDPTRRWRLAGLSHAGFQAGRRHAAVPLPPAPAAGARTGSDCRLRRRRRAGAEPRLLQPQPFQRRVPPGLRPLAHRIP